MSRYKRILSGILYFSIATISFAQMTVSGTVTDASTGEALAGANVVVDGTSKGYQKEFVYNDSCVSP